MASLMQKLKMLYDKCTYGNMGKNIIIARMGKTAHIYNNNTGERMFEEYTIDRARFGDSKEVGPVVYITTSNGELIYNTLRQNINRNISIEAQEVGLQVVSDFNQYLYFTAKTMDSEFIVMDEYLQPITEPVEDVGLLYRGYKTDILVYQVVGGKIRSTSIYDKNGGYKGYIAHRAKYISGFQGTYMYMAKSLGLTGSTFYDAKTLKKIAELEANYRVVIGRNLIIAISGEASLMHTTVENVSIFDSNINKFVPAATFFDITKTVKLDQNTVDIGIKNGYAWAIKDGIPTSFFGKREAVRERYGSDI